MRYAHVMKVWYGFFLLFLIGCAAGEPLDRAETEAASSVSSHVVPEQEKPLEQLPSEMSIEHFSQMQLVGTGLTLENVLADNAAYTRYDISYKSNGLTISGIMNIPKGTGPFPLLIFNHGYIAPSVYTQGRGLKREQDYMARNGFAVLHTDYRGHVDSDESPMVEKVYDGNLEYAMDSINAINAVRAAKLPTVDASRVGMLGHSMGGGVTLAILTAHPDMVDAAVLYAPVHADVWENFWRWRREREEGDLTMELYKTREENPDVWDRLSPKTYLGKVKTPILLFQGTNDKDVPLEWSQDLQSELEKHQKDSTYIEYAGEGHEFGFKWSDFMQTSADFFRQKLQAQ